MVGKSQRHPDIEPAHPGELLGEVVIPATGKSNVEIAALLGVSRQTLYEVVAQKRAITPAMAVRLGKLFGQYRWRTARYSTAISPMAAI